jgi:5-methylcytosine-specific restriction endonuclease McrA
MLATSRKVLVLNRSWSAVGLVSLPRAITLLFSTYKDGEPKAKIITPPPKGEYEVWSWDEWSSLKPDSGEDGLVSCSQIYKIPEVLLLSKYDSMPKQRVNFCRRAIWKRDRYTCQYCGRKPPQDECTLDHIVPKSLGGDTSWYNCVLACYQCNSQKADRKPEDAFRPIDKEKAKHWRGPNPMRLLKIPNKPEYSVIKDRIRILDTWKHWVDKMYWDIPLENDMEEDNMDFI